MMTPYILIVLLWGNSTHLEHIEFSTKEACMFAAEQTNLAMGERSSNKAFCVPKS